jgi:hypothetical protein
VEYIVIIKRNQKKERVFPVKSTEMLKKLLKRAQELLGTAKAGSGAS